MGILEGPSGICTDDAANLNLSAAVRINSAFTGSIVRSVQRNQGLALELYLAFFVGNANVQLDHVFAVSLEFLGDLSAAGQSGANRGDRGKADCIVA